MDYSFPRYLLSKQSVDDRALNKDVLAALQAALSATPSEQPLSIIEVGGGIGTMLARLLRWGLLPRADYTLVDEMQENIDYARAWLPSWAAQNNFLSKSDSQSASIRFSASESAPQSVTCRLLCADVFDYINTSPPPADLLIAHAFLDLLPMPHSLARLFSLLKPGGLAWLTINFDGVTTFEPPIRLSGLPSPEVSEYANDVTPIRLSAEKSAPASADAHIERLYHASMDLRPTGGDSQSGRHLFGHIAQAGGKILAAGASDWVVYPVQGQYPADEAYFLHFILHFFEQSLSGHPDLDPAVFTVWLATRRQQIENSELVYIAHQMDFLIQV